LIALIDSDIVAFRCAASCKGEDGPEIANIRADKLMRQILERTGSESYRAFLSGSRNWRKDLYPEYKANRRDMPNPEHLYSCKEFLIKEWNAEVSDGIEADDDISIAWALDPDGVVVCSIDKDFHQLHSSFYNFVKDEIYSINEIQAMRYFYKQTILGDKGDNVPGYDGKARQAPTKAIQAVYEDLEECQTAEECYKTCLTAYEEVGRTEDDLILTAKLLYLWRRNPDEWTPPIGSRET